MSRVEVGGTKGDAAAIKLMLLAEEDGGAATPLFSASSPPSFKNTVGYSPAALGDANRLSGRLCSKLPTKMHIKVDEKYTYETTLDSHVKPIQNFGN